MLFLYFEFKSLINKLLKYFYVYKNIYIFYPNIRILVFITELNFNNYFYSNNKYKHLESVDTSHYLKSDYYKTNQ